MNLLLDTDVALWAIIDDPRLSGHARALVAEPTNTIWVSVASLWEIMIKHTLGRGDMPLSGADALGFFRESGYRILPVEAEHAMAVASLPAWHQDPFDRMLLAQAMVEPLRLMTADAMVARYSDSVIRV